MVESDNLKQKELSFISTKRANIIRELENDIDTLGKVNETILNAQIELEKIKNSINKNMNDFNNYMHSLKENIKKPSECNINNDIDTNNNNIIVEKNNNSIIIKKENNIINDNNKHIIENEDNKSLDDMTDNELIEILKKFKFNSIAKIAKYLKIKNTPKLRKRLLLLNKNDTINITKLGVKNKIKLFESTSDEDFINIIQKYNTRGKIADHFGIKNTTKIDIRLEKLDKKYTIHLYDHNKIARYKLIQHEKLTEIVKNSKTWTELVKKIGYNTQRSGINPSLQKYLQESNIDFSHIPSGRNWQYSDAGKKIITSFSKKIPIEKILVENSTYKNGQNIKKRLIKEKNFIDKCNKCGISPENDKEDSDFDKLVLQLDHINGVNNDNRIENLRILCSNCHSKTKTYAGKNKAYLTETDKKTRQDFIEKNAKHCIVCNLEIGKTSTYCNKCGPSIRYRIIIERPSLEQLLEDVNTTSYIATGKKYGVSNTAIKKWIISYGVKPPKKYLKRESCEKKNLTLIKKSILV